MFLTELAFKVGQQLELTDIQIDNIKQDFLSNGKFLQDIENRKFKLYDFQSRRFGLFSDDNELIGVIDYDQAPKDILSIKRIFVLRQFRNQKIGTILLFWFKNVYEKSVYLGGPIFNDGQKFVQNIAKNGLFDLFSYNIRTQEKTKFDIDTFFDGKQFTGMLIESWEPQSLGWNKGFYDNSVLGNNQQIDMICLELFGEEVEEPINF